MANKSGLTNEEIKEALQKEYNRDNYLFIVKNYLVPDFDEDKREYKIDGKRSLFDKVEYFGNSKACKVAIFEVQLGKGNEKKRVGITQEMFGLLKNYAISNAIVAFVDFDKKHFRYSLLTAKYEIKEKKIVKMLSNPRRYSYALGFECKTKTAFDFLINNGQAKTHEELVNKFSVEVVNKEFYNAISNLYMKLVGGEKNGEQFNGLLKINSINNHNKFSEFAVRLIGRLIFCWFLKEKKSENGSRLIPLELFKKETIKKSTNYYHDVIEPLFFELLNTDKKYRKDKFGKEELYNQIPYLNGGLFNPYDDDYYKYDKTSECGTYGVVTIKNEWFVELFDVFNLYNFTVDENTAYDIELSIDPEMLGRVFENLLAEINPETGESARKNTGSFYTPREIVDYMVDSSILSYLQNNTEIEEKKLSEIISYISCEKDIELNNSEKISIINALYNVKTIDISCGSGAFPIGLLQKIVYILEKVDEDAELWFKKITENVDAILKEEYKKKFKNKELNYLRKLKVIQNSIFGIDIQPIAVEIARLRCFLSLIIEEKVVDNEENRGIKPLPSLEFKFIIANSLISLSNKNDSLNLFEQSFKKDGDFIEQLKVVRDEYFVADVIEKNNLKNKFDNIQKKMLKYTQDVLYGETTKRFDALSRWEPFENESTNWFDSEWMFGVYDGFDIVIGNPPYVQLQKSINEKKTKLGDLYINENFKTFQKTGDIYCLFYEKGIDLLRDNGILTFITSNKWMRAGYGEKLREFLSNNSNPIELIDFGGNKVFESATVDVNVLITQKAKNQNTTKSCTIKDKLITDIKEYVEENKSNVSFNTSSAWIISSNIEENIRRKIEEIGTPLKEWDLQIYRGILTGCNEAFIIDEETKNRIIKEDKKSAEIIRPILRGRDIKRYGYDFANLYLINTHNGIKSKGIPPINIKDYPGIKKHLDKYWDKISIRDDKGDTPYNLRNCIYTDYFLKQKIVYPCIMTKGPAFALDKKGEYYVVAPGNIITGKNISYLNDCLNSKVYYFALRKYYMGGGIEGELKTNRLLILPVPTSEQKSISESEIYQLLNLSINEINYINDEYEKLVKK